MVKLSKERYEKLMDEIYTESKKKGNKRVNEKI